MHDNYIIEDLYQLLAGSQLINATDINKWFHHIALDEDGPKYTAIRVKRGALMPLCMLQGFKNSSIFAHEVASKIFEYIAHCI